MCERASACGSLCANDGNSGCYLQQLDTSDDIVHIYLCVYLCEGPQQILFALSGTGLRVL